MKPSLIKVRSAELSVFDLAPAQPNGRTVLLLHGFASNARVNWISTGWAQVLLDEGYRVIAHDHRGHGDSSKFYDPSDYGPDIFAQDAVELLDHLGIEEVDAIGYSMGARVTAWLCHAVPQRIRCAVFGGMGSHIFGERRDYEPLAQALETDDPSTITDPDALGFRTFADRTGSDRHALAACIRPSKKRITPDLIESITVPVLIVVGSEDGISGTADGLADMMQDAEPVTLPGLDHMKATGAVAFKNAAVDFLKAHG